MKKLFNRIMKMNFAEMLKFWLWGIMVLLLYIGDIPRAIFCLLLLMYLNKFVVNLTINNNTHNIFHKGEKE